MAGSSSIPLALPESLEDRVGEDDEDDEPSDTAAASAASEISLGYSIQHEDSLDNLDSGTGDDFWENGTNDDATSPSLDIPVSPGQDEGINSPSAESVNTYSSGIDNNAPNIYDIRTSSSVSLDANLNESTETSRTDNTNFVSDSGLLSQALKLFSLIQEHNITGARELLEQMEPNQRQEVCDMHVSDKTVATSVAEAGMVDVLEMLTDYDVTLSGYDNYGKAPIHYAAEHGHILAVYFITSTNKKNREMVDILVNMTTKYGNLTALHIAAAGENVEVIDLLVLRGSDMNARDITGNTPLHLAAKQGSVVIPERLLEHGAEVNLQNKMGETALFCACQHGHAETVSVLSTHGANVNIPQELGWTPLHIACHNAHTVIIYQLLDLNADPYCLSRDKSMPVILACRHRLKSAIRRMIFRKGESKRMQEPDPLVIFKMAQVASVSDFSVVKECGVNVNTQNYFKQTALHHAARNGDIGAMMTLLSATASTDIWDNNGNFPLHLALLHRHTEVAKQLILHGTPLNRQNRWHQSCLYLAIQNGNYDLIELLLRNSADPNSVDPQGGSLIALAIRNDTVRLLEMLLRYGGNSMGVVMQGLRPIHAAAKLGHTEMCRLLLQHGVNVHIPDSVMMRTPLHLAAEAGHLSTVVELLSHGADVNAVDSFNKKPLHIAAAEGHKDIVEVLLDTGTRVLLCDDDGSVEYDLAKNEEIWDIIRSWAATNDPTTIADAPPSYDSLSLPPPE